MLDIVYSKYNDDIEDFIFSKATEYYKNNEEVYLFVPEQFTLQNEIKLVEILNGKAISRIKIMSFQRFALEVLTLSGGNRRKYIDNIGKRMILTKVLSKNKDNLKFYSSSVDKKGFVDLILSQISDLKLNMITPDLLCSYSDVNNEVLGKKIFDIANIYRGYEKEIEDKYIDNENRLGQLSEQKDLVNWSNKKFLFYGYIDFTKVEKEIINNIISSNIDLTIGLCLDDSNNETFTLTRDIRDYLNKIAIENSVCVKHNNIENYDKKRNEIIKHLSEEVFKVSPREYKGDNNETSVEDYNDVLRIYSASSFEDEISHIAMDISKKVSEEGYRYKDFLVATTRINEYDLIFKQVFSKFEIPFFIDEKREITSNSIIKLIISTLNLISGDFSIENIMMFLKNDITKDIKDYVDAETEAITNNQIYDFENFLNSKKIKNNMFLNDKYFDFSYLDEKNVTNNDKESLKKIEDEKYRENVIKVREKLLYLFKDKKFNKNEKNTVENYSKVLIESLEEQDIYNKIEVFISSLRKMSLLDEANENKQICDVFVRTIEQSAQVFGGELITIDEYKSMLLSALTSVKLSLVPPSKDQVLIVDIERSRVLPKKHIYICGADSDSLPKLATEESLIGDEDKEELFNQGIKLPIVSNTNTFSEQLYIYLLLTRAEESISFSYIADSGKTPSEIIENAITIFKDLKVKTIDDFKDYRFIPSIKASLDMLSKKLRDFNNNDDIEEIWKDLFCYLYNSNNKDELIKILLGINYSKNINNKLVPDAYRYPINISTTRLSNFSDCQFKHFIKYALKPQERRDYSINPIEIGNIMHSTIENFTNKIKGKNIEDIEEAEIEDIVNKSFDEAKENLLKGYDLDDDKNKFFLSRLNKTIVNVAKTTTSHLKDGSFKVFGQEIKFGEENKKEVKNEANKEANNTDNNEIILKPIAIKKDGKEGRLKGIIDRVDTFNDGKNTFIKVIDYKTSDKKFSFSDVINGFDMQLLIYMSTLLEAKEFFGNEICPAGIFYFPIVKKFSDGKNDKSNNLKMHGIVVNDDNIMKALDKNFKTRSSIFSTPNIGKMSSQDFSDLIKYIRNNIEEDLEKIISGEINIKPSNKNGNIACKYCDYSSICMFEESLGYEYKDVKSLNEEEILKKLNDFRSQYVD